MCYNEWLETSIVHGLWMVRPLEGTTQRAPLSPQTLSGVLRTLKACIFAHHFNNVKSLMRTVRANPTCTTPPFQPG